MPLRLAGAKLSFKAWTNGSRVRPAAPIHTARLRAQEAVARCGSRLRRSQAQAMPRGKALLADSAARFPSGSALQLAAKQRIPRCHAVSALIQMVERTCC